MLSRLIFDGYGYHSIAFASANNGFSLGDQPQGGPQQSTTNKSNASDSLVINIDIVGFLADLQNQNTAVTPATSASSVAPIGDGATLVLNAIVSFDYVITNNTQVENGNLIDSRWYDSSEVVIISGSGASR